MLSFSSFNEKHLKQLFKARDIEGIYILAYKRQLLALAWSFAARCFGLTFNTHV